MAEEKVNKKAEIESLKNKLKREDDQNEKRRIRARLRTLGHSGGLGEPRGAKKKAKKTVPAKKGKRASREAEPVAA